MYTTGRVHEQIVIFKVFTNLGFPVYAMVEINCIVAIVRKYSRNYTCTKHKEMRLCD